MEKNHKRLGYDASFAEEDLEKNDLIGWGISDHSLLEQALSEVAQIEGPYFAHIVLLTNHHPFSFVRESMELPAKGIVNDYLISARYVDSVVKALFEKLTAKGQLENTIIAVYSDHDSGITQELLEHLEQPYQEGAAFEKIPLVIFTGKKPKNIERLAGLQDLAPTVLFELGIDVPVTFIGTPAQCQGGDILFQNNTRAIRTPDGGTTLEPLKSIDLSTLTRLVIEEPEALQ